MSILAVTAILFASTAFAEPPVKKAKPCACAVTYNDNVTLTRYYPSDYSAPEAIVWVEYYPGSPWLQHSSFLGKTCKVLGTFTSDGVDCAGIYFTWPAGTQYAGAVWNITVPCSKLTKL